MNLPQCELSFTHEILTPNLNFCRYNFSANNWKKVDHLFCNHFSRNSRKVVREKWFKKSGSRNLVQEIRFEKSGFRIRKKIQFLELLFFPSQELEKFQLFPSKSESRLQIKCSIDCKTFIIKEQKKL